MKVHGLVSKGVIVSLILIGITVASAGATTVTVVSDANTQGVGLGLQGAVSAADQARIYNGDISGLAFSPVDTTYYGSFTPVPAGAPSGTIQVSLPGSSYYNGESGFFLVTFNLPTGFTGASLSGEANADDCGAAYLNGNLITPQIYSGSGIQEGGDYAFSTANPLYFETGVNQFVIADPNWVGGDPSAAAFYINVSYSAVPIPGAVLLFAPGLAGLAVIRRRLKK